MSYYNDFDIEPNEDDDDDEKPRGFPWEFLMGAVTAFILSYYKWKLIGWAIMAAMFSWAYVIYYLFAFGWPS